MTIFYFSFYFIYQAVIQIGKYLIFAFEILLFQSLKCKFKRIKYDKVSGTTITTLFQALFFPCKYYFLLSQHWQL